MKHFNKEYLAKYPKKRGQDLATTRHTYARYKSNPMTMFNFLESTHLTPTKPIVTGKQIGRAHV